MPALGFEGNQQSQGEGRHGHCHLTAADEIPPGRIDVHRDVEDITDRRGAIDDLSTRTVNRID